MFRRLLLCSLLAALAVISRAEESFIGMFIGEQKIGWSSTSGSDVVVGGKTLKKSVSKTVMNAGLLGQAVTITIDLVTWTTPDGKPTLMKYEMASAGRSQKVEANFIGDQVKLAIDQAGTQSTKTLAVPKDAPIVDDALNALLESGATAGMQRVFYVLDPTTLSFVKNTAKLVGPQTIEEAGKSVNATLVEIVEPRVTTKVYLSAKGDMIRAESVAGIIMRPISKEEALAENTSGGFTDLADVTRMTVSPDLGNPSAYKKAVYRFNGGDFSRAPSDASQSIKKQGSGWIVSITPIMPTKGRSTATIAASAKAVPIWTKPGLNIPSDNVSMRQLAKKVVGTEKRVVEAAQLVGAHVYAIMRPNAGIGVLRNANEILKTKEGVCRDYAILTATLLRASGIPARLASGLVYQDGAFYYHAWTEVWDGRNWFGVDSTRPRLDVTVGHVKLAHGSVEDAFLFTFLDKVKVELISKEPKIEKEHRE